MATSRSWRSWPPVPDGWFDYSPFGTPIEKSRIIAVKTPLKQAFNNGKRKCTQESDRVDYRSGVSLEDEFTPTQLVERLKEMGLNLCAVIDLTYTKRYYNPEEFIDLGVKHAKVMCPGKEIPNDVVYEQFASALNEFLRDGSESDLVAVHCTHGLNRTGYLVCRYLVENCSFTAEEAIKGFNKARGYDIERENYLEHLRKGCPPLQPKSPRRISSPRSPKQDSSLTSNRPPHQAQRNQHTRRNSPHPRNKAGKSWHSEAHQRGNPYLLPAPEDFNGPTTSPEYSDRGSRHGRRRERHRRRRRRDSDQSGHSQTEPSPSFHDGRDRDLRQWRQRSPVHPPYDQHSSETQWYNGPHSHEPRDEFPSNHWLPPRENGGPSPDYNHCNGFARNQEHFANNDATSNEHTPTSNSTDNTGNSASNEIASGHKSHNQHSYSRTCTYLVAAAIVTVTTVLVFRYIRNNKV